MEPKFAKLTENGLVLMLHVVPGAKKSEIAGLHGDRIKLRIAAPPVEGQANQEVIRFCAFMIGVRKNQVNLTSGESSRQKTVQIECHDSKSALAQVLELVSRSD